MPATRKGWIPATRAEMHAWWFGARMADDDAEVVTSLAASKLHPAGYLTDDEERAWARLGAQRFWTWALHGFRAKVEEEDGL